MLLQESKQSIFNVYNIHFLNYFLDYQLQQAFRIYCPNHCGRSYTGAYRKKNLKNHLLFECGVEPQFQCSICRKRFSRKSNLKTHVVLIHKSLLQPPILVFIFNESLMICINYFLNDKKIIIYTYLYLQKITISEISYYSYVK